MRKKIIIFGLLAIIFTIVLVGTKTNAPTKQNEKMKISASFYPIAYFAERVGGSMAEVFTITPAGAEPHDYEPSAQDIAQISDSKILFMNGGGLETWGNSIELSIDASKTMTIITGKDITPQTKKENGESVTDPHYWLSPALAGKMVERITLSFTQADPVHAAYYGANAEELRSELQMLDADYREGLSHCIKKSFVTSHSAFSYLATQYGIKQVSIAGISPDAEPSSKQMANIVTFIKNNDVKYIFTESLVSPKLSETIANETGTRMLILNPMEGLTKDEKENGKNYFTEMRQNLSNLQTALECK